MPTYRGRTSITRSGIPRSRCRPRAQTNEAESFFSGLRRWKYGVSHEWRARNLHDPLIVSSTFELPVIDSMWSTQLHRPSIAKKETSNAAPAFYRLRDVVRICAISRSTIFDALVRTPGHSGLVADALISFRAPSPPGLAPSPVGRVHRLLVLSLARRTAGAQGKTGYATCLTAVSGRAGSIGLFRANAVNRRLPRPPAYSSIAEREPKRVPSRTVKPERKNGRRRRALGR